jgi:hypothetical protein
MSYQTRIRVMIFIIALISTMFACNLFQTENQKTTQQGFYAIDPETILSALANEENNVFLPVTELDFDRSAPPTGSPVNWTQTDYLYIVDAFYKQILHDTLDNWNLSSMSFSLICADVDVGLQDGDFGFFKAVMNENNQEVLISRYIEVDPSNKVVLLWEREFYPYVITRSPIDLTSLKFDGAKVLQMAEDNGGRNRRLSLNNVCSVRLSLSPDSAEYSGWNVYYTRSDSDRSVFQINIDPFNGNIR